MGKIFEKIKSLKWIFEFNVPVDIPILAAVVGLLYGIAVFHLPGYHSTGQFHDLSLKNKRALVDTLLSKRTAFVQNEINRLTIKQAGPDSTTIGDTLPNYRIIQKQTAIQSVNLSHFNVDTSLVFFTEYFSADRDELLGAITTEKDQVPIRMKDTCCSPYPTNAVLDGSVTIGRERKDLVEFFNRYSGFGFWFVLW